jgi:Fe-S cluster assembly protein SufD
VTSATTAAAPPSQDQPKRKALERFRAKGFPTVRDEEWRYTNPAPLAARTWAMDGAATAAPPVPAGALLEGFESSRLVFVDGRFNAQLSAVEPVEGLRISGVAEAVDHGRAAELGFVSHPGHVFAPLNLGHVVDGAVIEIAPRAVVEKPIHIVLVAGAGEGEPAVHPRVFVAMGSGSRAAIVESFTGPDRKVYWTNAVAEIVLGEGAALEYVKVQDESTAAFHTASITVRQARDSRFQARAVHVGAALSRDDIAVSLDGPGASCELEGLFAPAGEQHHDTHSRIDHVAPHGRSHEYYKGVVTDRARGVFHGRIVVGAGAQKTDAKQTNKNLLLSREALVNSTPQLEILADDVKCKHGSTTGQIDPAALFYLRSRGIGEEDARRLLVHAFAAEILARIKPESLRRGIGTVLEPRLGRLAEEGVA